MQLHDLNVPKGSRKKKKRVGRGVGSGHGKTSTRGMNGQGQRSSPDIGLYFEGGQTPLIRRIPKRGFNNKRFRTEYQILNISDLGIFNEGDEVTLQKLKDANLIKDLKIKVKILGDGKIEKKLQISVHAFSKSAQKKIADCGGKAIQLKA